MKYKPQEDYKLYLECRFCGKKLSSPVIDLGNMPLAGGFLRSIKDFSKEKLFPLTLAFCDNCYLLQTREVIDADRLFKNYFYHSSSIKTLVNHFEKLAKECSNYTSSSEDNLIVEIGCNDATFIKACSKKGHRAVGVDPATNIVNPLIKQGLPIINDYFSENTAKRIVKKYGKADLIFSSNTLAHIEDMHTVFNGIKNLLKEDGTLIFEVHYLGNLMKEHQYDMIYHEHQYYYSVNALVNFLQQFDMHIYNLKFIPIHAGSIRIYAQKNSGKKRQRKVVTNILVQEIREGLTKRKTFEKYGLEIAKTKSDLLVLLNKVLKRKQTIAGYGASGRGTIIMNYCGLTDKYLQYVIDDATAKQGAFTPGNHLEIVSSDILASDKRPDYVVLFAWSFWQEIKKRNDKYIAHGGKFIVPLPRVKIVK